VAIIYSFVAGKSSVKKSATGKKFFLDLCAVTFRQRLPVIFNQVRESVMVGEK
jgi:hypothetical protein